MLERTCGDTCSHVCLTLVLRICVGLTVTVKVPKAEELLGQNVKSNSHISNISSGQIISILNHTGNYRVCYALLSRKFMFWVAFVCLFFVCVCDYYKTNEHTSLWILYMDSH